MQELAPAALDFGGSNAYSGVSTSRTLMLGELHTLLATTPGTASLADYRRAIVDENVLLKPSSATRSRTFSYLRDRYGLDPSVPVFTLLRTLWERDEAGQPLMALLVAALRDPVLRSTLPVMIGCQPDQPVPSAQFSHIIANAFPDKLNENTLKATSERMTSTYRQSGHLKGRTRTVRQRVQPTPGSTTIALLLATLDGASGRGLLSTNWVQILDSSPETVLAEARIAANRGWLEYRQAGDVLELTFRTLLSRIGELAGTPA